MRMSINIPEELLEEAQKVAETATKTQAIILALSEMIQRRRSNKILELKGSMETGSNYRKSRKKR